MNAQLKVISLAGIQSIKECLTQIYQIIGDLRENHPVNAFERIQDVRDRLKKLLDGFNQQ